MNKILNKIIEYGIYLLVFSLPWQTRWLIKEGSINESYSEYGSLSLYGVDILLGLLLVFYFIYYFKTAKDRSSFKMPLYFYAIALLELIAFISIFVAKDHILAAYKYFNLLLAIGFFALIAYFPYNKNKLLISFSLSLLIQSGLGMYQFLIQHSPVNKWLGMAAHIPYDAGVSVVEAMGSLGFVERWLRAYGSLPHPNILGGFLALGLMVTLFYFVIRRKSTYLSETEGIEYTIFRENVFYNFISIFTVIAIFFSFSRSAWLATFVFSALFLLLSIFKKDILAQKFMLPKLLYMGVVLFIATYPFMNLIEARVESKGKIEVISQTERASSSSMAIGIIKDNWLTGTGLGNYTLSVSQDYIQGQKGYFYQPAHNTFLLVATELGIAGIIAFIFLIISIFFRSGTSGTWLYRLPFLVALVIILYFDHWLWSLHFGVLYFWFLLAISLRFFTLDSKESDVV